MSDKLSRRDFFAFLARPATQAARRVAAQEQRARAVRSVPQDEADARCAQCYAVYPAESGETLCPDCRVAQAKNQALLADLFKAK